MFDRPQGQTRNRKEVHMLDHPVRGVQTALCLMAIAMLGVPMNGQAGEAMRAQPNSARVVTLVLQPARLGDGEKPRLLPGDEGRTEGDGAALLEKAAQSLPRSLNSNHIGDWRFCPLNELPQAEVQTVLEQAKASLDLIRQATRCKGCSWPPFKPGTMPANLSEYRTISFLLCVQAKLAIAQRQYDKAIETTGTGLAMAKQVGEAPTVMQGMVGVGMTAVMLQCVEDMAQAQGSPNLYAALQGLPRPLVDMEKPISSERKYLESDRTYNTLVRTSLQTQQESSFEKVRVGMHRQDAHRAALECIEALRHYAATHENRLPGALGDIQGATPPNDPSTGRPFAYRLEGTSAILEVQAPKGGTPREGRRYELSIAK